MRKLIRELIKESITNILNEKKGDQGTMGTAPVRNPFEKDEFNLGSNTGIPVADIGYSSQKKESGIEKAALSSKSKSGIKKDASSSKKKSVKQLEKQQDKKSDEALRGLDWEVSLTQQSDIFDRDWAKKELNKTADFFNNTVLPWADDSSDRSKLYVDDEYHTIIVAHPDDPDTVAPLISGTFKANTHIKKRDMIAQVKSWGKVRENLQTLYDNLQDTSKNLGINLPFQSLSDEEYRNKMSQYYSNRK